MQRILGLDAQVLQSRETLAEWCWKQKHRAHDICSAAVVGFYEHLTDDQGLCEGVPYWLKSEIFDDMRDGFKSRMTTDEYEKLVARYNVVNHTDYR